MVNEHSTVSNIQELIDKIDDFDRVMVSHNTDEEAFIYEAYNSDEIDDFEGMDIESRLPMLTQMYGASISIQTSTWGNKYYRIAIPDSGLIDDKDL